MAVPPPPATLGQRVQVISATGSFTGTAKAVTDSGSLIVLDDDGRSARCSRRTYPSAG